MNSILARILEAKRARLAAGEFAPKGRALLPSDGARFTRALAADGPSVIAEIKRRSPSAGVLLPDAGSRLTRMARDYRRGGAAAISVVVEQDFFGGDPAWLPAVKAASGLPVLMKDFILDEAQLDFALSLGADAVLLIASALQPGILERLHAAARERGLAVLVEAHDVEEARRAGAAGAKIIGINARDLKTFAVDLETTAALGPLLPQDVVRVAESGIRTREDVATLARSGFGAFLVGESLLAAEDPARALRLLRGENPTEVKVCGITREEDVAACEAAGVDWIGMNFSPCSPRRLDLSDAERLRARVAFAKGAVAVFAENSERDIRDVTERLRPDVLQLTDPPAKGASSWPLPIWQTVRVGRDDPRRAVAEWPAEALLFDTAADGRSGGTGRAFDWSLLEALAPSRPVVLAGGLHPGNVAEAVRRVRPLAVDVASGVESSPRVKDAAKIQAFVEEVRRA